MSFSPPLPLRVAAAAAAASAAPTSSDTSCMPRGGSLAVPSAAGGLSTFPTKPAVPPQPLRLFLSSSPFDSNMSAYPGYGTAVSGLNASNGHPISSPSPRRPRNMKGLSIQSPFLVSSPAFSACDSNMSEPISPSFIKPFIPSMKRRPSLLSLNTNTSELPDIRRKPSEPLVPPSPALTPSIHRRTLKHSTSTPHMLSALKSSDLCPEGGMTLLNMLERNESGLSAALRPHRPVPAVMTYKNALLTSFDPTDQTIREEESPIRPQLASRANLDHEPFAGDDSNEDRRSPCYPDGPIAIYDDNVFLYMEPDAETASGFDLVINVAREVQTPFLRQLPEEKASGDQEWSRAHTSRSLATDLSLLLPSTDSSANPDTAASQAFSMAASVHPISESAVHRSTQPMSLADTPTTARSHNYADSHKPQSRPEYIHMPWDHNTDISPDLLSLCETIESRTQQGKRVLIHCQQGASRSASLVIAYGMYLNPELSVNDAYYAAQAKSRWISPNMKLMYCLQDFQKELANRRLPPHSAFSNRLPLLGRSSSQHQKHRLPLSANAAVPQEPKTAPLLGQGHRCPDSASSFPVPVASELPSIAGISAIHRRGNSSPFVQLYNSRGLSSAPASFSCVESSTLEAAPKPSGAVPAPCFPPQAPSTTVDNLSTCIPSPGDEPPRVAFKRQSPLSYKSRPQVPPRLCPSRSFFTPLSGQPLDYFDLPPPPSLSGAFPDDLVLLSPRAEAMTKNLFRNYPAQAAQPDTALLAFRSLRPPIFLHAVNTDSTPPFSPLASRFRSFGLTATHLAAMPYAAPFSSRASRFLPDLVKGFGNALRSTDPRSPPVLGEIQIVRSIDEVL